VYDSSIRIILCFSGLTHSTLHGDDDGFDGAWLRPLGLADIVAVVTSGGVHEITSIGGLPQV
jgi:hypothetical protein